ncbi:hypothetical protein EDB81DRAFT_757061 [Dactylonectria macrodidyma]|uniref:Uncharacterized protein n=1 Tax=Dactylonectria macrodidyma TaxID=307937 RepID=A0A9P9JFY9_9HYPO|nr:hypothetical protein EDB81DRAFT_757061 [Dactylonectria macrodidyma]
MTYQGPRAFRIGTPKAPKKGTSMCSVLERARFLNTTSETSVRVSYYDEAGYIKKLTNFKEDRLLALSGVAKEFRIAIRKQEEKDQGRDGSTQRGERLRGKRAHLYVSGSWFGFCQGLVWEQVAPGPRVRISGLPTWSWASMASQTEDDEGKTVLTGMSVKWATLGWNRRETAIPRLICEMKRALTVEVDGESLEPMFERTCDEPPTNEYDILHRFVVLEMHGKLLPIRVRGRLRMSTT